MKFPLSRNRLDATIDMVEESEFIPLTEVSHYAPPSAYIDSDQQKSWLSRARPIVWSHKGVFGLSLLMSFISLLTQVQIPRLIGTAIDNLGRVPLSHYAIILFIAIGIREISNYIGRRFLLGTAYAIEYDLRNIIYEHLTQLSFSFYDKVHSGQLISRANSDVRAVQMYLVMAPTIIVQCAVVVIAFVEMFTINKQLALVTMFALPFTFICGTAMRKKIFPVSWLIQARLAEVAQIVEENIGGVRVVKSFAAEQRELTTLAKAADGVQWGYIKDANVRATWSPILENLPRLGLAVILLYGGVLAIHFQLGSHRIQDEVGVLFTFQAYMLLFQSPFRQLGMVIMMGQRASASAKRIYEILDKQPQVVNRPGAVELRNCQGDVVFRDVTFAYEGAGDVLSHFNLQISHGETVALVGRTGSGKSTTARLLNRSYDINEGVIEIDGVDIANYTLESLRSNVGIVFDEPFLFSVSIRDNIAYGRPDADLNDIIDAAKAAGAHEFIEQMPAGYDTVIGERGYTLSGGQRQRLAIARTVLLNPPVLILDDATSAIDVRMEQEIHNAFRSLMTHRTTLVIAHRLSTISLANRVALLEDGKIVALGTHAELLETEPRYSEILAQAIVDENDLGEIGEEMETEEHSERAGSDNR